MSRLSEILGVKEGQEFRFDDRSFIYKVVGNMLVSLDGAFKTSADGLIVYFMIDHPELIHPITEKSQLTDQQITAIKGRIAEGTLWAARNSDKQESVFFFIHKPCFSERYESWCGDEDSRLLPDSLSGSSIYNFVTELNSPVYLPELVGERKVMERLSDTAIEIINDLHTERLEYTSEYIPLIDSANKLAEYEDLEEQGLLLRLSEKGALNE